MTRPHLPTRTLRDRPDLDQLKRQAKELLQAFADGDAAAAAEVTAHYRGADPQTFALHDAQLVTCAGVRIRELAEAQSLRGRRHGQAADRRRSRARPRRRSRAAQRAPGAGADVGGQPAGAAPRRARRRAGDGAHPDGPRRQRPGGGLSAPRRHDRSRDCRRTRIHRDRRHHRGRGTEVAGRAERRGRGAACRRPVPRDRIRRLPPCHNDAGRQPGAGPDATRSL